MGNRLCQFNCFRPGNGAGVDDDTLDNTGGAVPKTTGNQLPSRTSTNDNAGPRSAVPPPKKEGDTFSVHSVVTNPDLQDNPGRASSAAAHTGAGVARSDLSFSRQASDSHLYNFDLRNVESQESDHSFAPGSSPAISVHSSRTADSLRLPTPEPFVQETDWSQVCTSKAALLQRIQQLTAWTDPSALFDDVAAKVRAGCRQAGDDGRNFVCLLVEQHTSGSATAMALAALKGVHDVHGANAMLLLELDKEELEGIKADASFLLGQKSDSAFDFALKRMHEEDAQTTLTTFKAMAALALGMNVGRFDPEKDNPSEDAREAGMVASLQQQLGASGRPTIVISGALHLQTLLAALKPLAHTAGLVGVEETQADMPDSAIPRMSYALSNPELQLYKSPDRVPVAKLDQLRQLAIDKDIPL